MGTPGVNYMSTTELLEKYISYLGVKQGRARSAAHIREVHRRVSRMLAGLESVDVLTSERIEATLYELAQEIVTKPGSPPRARSAQTIDGYRRELGTFCRWLQKRRVLTTNPVDGVDRFEAADPRDHSRPFSPAEFAAFFENCPVERLAIYLFWATTGLRPGETRRLLWGQLVFKPSDGSSPYVEIWRSTAKNRKAVRQPLHPDVVKLLAPFVRKSTDAAFPSIPTPNTFLKDLRAAGLESVRSTAEGRLSRTSLRKLFATSLARGGTPLPLTQRLMRHSTPNLTSNVYTNFEVDEKARAVEQLGFLPPWRRPA
jgi:integrase